MTKQIKIALYSSQPQSGKSFTANILKDKGYEVYRFAETLKKMLRVFLGNYFSIKGSDLILDEYIDGDKKENIIEGLGVSTRHLMVTLGIDWGRNCVHPNIWSMLCIAKIIKSDSNFIVIDDLRFKNEYKLLKSHGFKFIHIKADTDKNNYTNRAEGALDGEEFDLTVTNDYSPSFINTILSYLETLSTSGS